MGGRSVRISRSSRTRVWLFVVGLVACVACSVLAAPWADAQSPGPVVIITREQATSSVRSIATRIWEASDQRRGMRTLQFADALPAGTTIAPAFAGRGEAQQINCRNGCWLFMIDKAPGTHFAHPVTFVVVDVVTGEQQVMDAEWWPEVAGPGIERRQLFRTVEERRLPGSVVLERAPVKRSTENNQPETEPSSAPRGGPPAPPPGFASAFGSSVPPCEEWAVIVCGWDDLPDTFDEDTNGMYAALMDRGIPADHIYYLSPHSSHAGVDLPTSRTNVAWAINQAAAKADAGDKVLFFYSSHGGINGLSCMDEGIGAAELDGWLDAIVARELTVIIEACHSGSFIGLYADGTYIAAEDELTGDGETNRAVFTSASTDTSSAADVDNERDPNPLDAGSESIWGYIEALLMLGGDANSNGAISFAEAVQYAWDNDVSRIDGWNTPQHLYTVPDPDRVYQHCFPTVVLNDPFGAACTGSPLQFAPDGSGSENPAPCGDLTFLWTTDCPGASFDDPTLPAPQLTVDPGGTCIECAVDLTVSCNEGAEETRSAPVSITDLESPRVSCPADRTVQCDEPTDPTALGRATAEDGCDPTPGVTYSDMTSAGACPQAMTIARTWTAVDRCGNRASCEQAIEVVDADAPLVSCNAPATITPSDAPVSFTATVTDNCDGAPAVGIINYTCLFQAPNGKVIDKSESCVVVQDGATITILDSGGVGDVITWTVRSADACGNVSEVPCQLRVVRKKS